MAIDEYVIKEPQSKNETLPEISIQYLELDEAQIQIRNKIKLLENILGPLSNTKP